MLMNLLLAIHFEIKQETTKLQVSTYTGFQSFQNSMCDKISYTGDISMRCIIRYPLSGLILFCHLV